MSEQTRRPKGGNGATATAEPEITLPLSETSLDPIGDDDDQDLGAGTDEDDDSGDTGSDELGDEDEEEEAPPDPLVAAEAEAAAARRDADREALREEVRAEEAAKTLAAQEAAAATARTEKVKGSYAQTVRTVNAQLRNHVIAIPGEGGEQIEVRLGDLVDDQTLQTLVFDHLNTYNGDVREAQAIEVYGGLGKAAVASLPAETAKKFADDFTGKPLDEWVAGLIEAGAEHSEWGKKQALALKTTEKTSLAKGIRIGKGMDPEQPTQEGTAGRAPRKTWAQLQAGYGAGTNTSAEDAEYHRQDAERAKNK